MDMSLNEQHIHAGQMTSLRVHRKVEIAQQIHLFELRATDGQSLPAFDAGSHILVRTPSGEMRRYSLCNAPGERYRYVIAVKRDAEGSGGSISMADQLAAGDLVGIAPPVNYFPLDTTASRHLLIAGGIGITPILAMARQLLAQQADFRIVYCSRSPETAAFLDELASPELAARTLIHHDYGDRERSLPLLPLLAERAQGAHVYCCGPRPLMQAVRDASSHWPASTVHFEDFGTSAHVGADGEQAFKVRLARSNAIIDVPAGITILDALRTAGYEVPSSCESGTCGSCSTGLLGGTAEHRDFVLGEDEQDKEIMICVSRARSAELVLDL